MDTTVTFSPNEFPVLCQHSFEKFLLYGRKCLEKTAGKEGKRIRNVQLASMSLSLSNKYKGIFETTKQGRRNKSAMHKRLNDYVR